MKSGGNRVLLRRTFSSWEFHPLPRGGEAWKHAWGFAKDWRCICAV